MSWVGRDLNQRLCCWHQRCSCWQTGGRSIGANWDIYIVGLGKKWCYHQDSELGNQVFAFLSYFWQFKALKNAQKSWIFGKFKKPHQICSILKKIINLWWKITKIIISGIKLGKSSNSVEKWLFLEEFKKNHQFLHFWKP